MRLRLFSVIAAGFCFGALCAAVTLGLFGTASGPSAGVGGQAGRIAASGRALIGGPFSLTNHLGGPMTHRDLQARGDLLVVFGYTRSENITPLALKLVTDALNGLNAADVKKKFQPVFITLDPAYDTPKVLADYLSRFHPSFVGLTGSVADIDAIAKAYKIFFSRPDSADQNFSIRHSAFIYLMDAGGQYIAHLRLPTQLNKLDSLLRSRL